MDKRIPIIILLVMVLSSCASAPAETISPEYLPMVIEPGVASTPLPEETSPPASLILQAGELSLTILSPVDGAVTSATPVELRLVSNEDTVLTIDGDLYLLDAEKEYTFLLALMEGYNSIELVASDYAGNQVEKVLTIILELSQE